MSTWRIKYLDSEEGDEPLYVEIDARTEDEALDEWALTCSGDEVLSVRELNEKLYIDAGGGIVRSERNPDKSVYKLIPKTLGVNWHDDQSCNEIVIGLAINGADYVFNSREDQALTEEYADQLAYLLH